MKLELERIPVWDGVRSGSECYICDLMGEAESDAIAFYLGSSVMNPETRVRVNESGFCTTHWQLLLAANKSQGLSLMADTYLAASRARMQGSLADLSRAKGGGAPRPPWPDSRSSWLSGRQGVWPVPPWRDGCNATSSPPPLGAGGGVQSGLARFKGFCLHHFSLLLERGLESDFQESL